MWLLKPVLDQNSIVIHLKSNDNFKSHINFKRIKEWYVASLYYEPKNQLMKDRKQIR